MRAAGSSSGALGGKAVGGLHCVRYVNRRLDARSAREKYVQTGSFNLLSNQVRYGVSEPTRPSWRNVIYRHISRGVSERRDALFEPWQNFRGRKRQPVHMSQQLVQTVKPQDLVSVDGFIEYQGTIHATTITNPASQQSVVDTPPSPQNPPPGPGQEARQPISANGMIKVLTHAARGEIDGAVLDNGTIVHFLPPVGTEYANLFQVGAPLAAVGYGTINTYGRSLEATSIGASTDHLQTVTAIDERPRGGPGERPRPIPAPAG